MGGEGRGRRRPWPTSPLRSPRGKHAASLEVTAGKEQRNRISQDSEHEQPCLLRPAGVHGHSPPLGVVSKAGGVYSGVEEGGGLMLYPL